MNADLCRFSLAITPDWSYFLIPFGALVFALGILRVYLSQSGGSFEFPGKVTLENFNPMLLFTVGVFVLIVGVGALVAHEDQTFARWVGEKLPILIAEADKQVNADLYAKPLGELVSGASPKSLYKFEVSPDAAKVPITGDFEDALCDADLLLQICNKLPGQLFCRTDTQARTIRICTKANSKPCKA
jgi:hypothetical protein